MAGERTFGKGLIQTVVALSDGRRRGLALAIWPCDHRLLGTAMGGMLRRTVSMGGHYKWSPLTHVQAQQWL